MLTSPGTFRIGQTFEWDNTFVVYAIKETIDPTGAVIEIPLVARMDAEDDSPKFEASRKEAVKHWACCDKNMCKAHRKARSVNSKYKSSK